MNIAEVVSLLASFASLLLAVLAIWLSLYHKREADQTNLQTRDLMLEIRSDAKSVTNIAVPEMRAYGDAMRRYVLSGPSEKFLQTTVPIIRKTSTLPSSNKLETGDPIEDLAALLEQIQTGTGYSASQRNLALKFARQIAGNSNIDHDKAMETIEELLDLFSQSDQSRGIDQIYKLFDGELFSKSGIVQSLLNYYGVLIIGERKDAEQYLPRFKEAVDASYNLGVQEFAIHPLLVMAHSKGDKDEINQLFETARSLNPEQKLTIVEAFERRSDPYKIQSNPGREVRKLAENYKIFGDEYSSDIVNLS